MTKARAGRWVKHASTFAKQNPFVTRHARSTLVRRSAVHRPQAVDRCKFSCPILPLSAPRRQCSCPTDVLRTTTLTARKEKGFATLFHAPRAEGGACMALLLRTITGTLAPRKTSGCGQHLGSQPFSCEIVREATPGRGQHVGSKHFFFAAWAWQPFVQTRMYQCSSTVWASLHSALFERFRPFTLA